MDLMISGRVETEFYGPGYARELEGILKDELMRRCEEQGKLTDLPCFHARLRKAEGGYALSGEFRINGQRMAFSVWGETPCVAARGIKTHTGEDCPIVQGEIPLLAFSA